MKVTNHNDRSQFDIARFFDKQDPFALISFHSIHLDDQHWLAQFNTLTIC